MGGTHGYTVSTQDMLTCTALVLPALSDYSLNPRLLVCTLSVPPLTLGLPSTPQSLRTFHLTLGSSRLVFVHAGFILVHRGRTWR